MQKRPLTAWLRPALTFFGVCALATLAACGGGNGSPNNPYTPPSPTPSPLAVNPSAATAYPGVPSTLTVSGGFAPYRAFSSDSAVLPVSVNVSGDTVLLLANAAAVAANTTVTITIQDSASVQKEAVITVIPAPLLPNLITITPNTDCGVTPSSSQVSGALCSGGNGSAVVKLTGPGGAAMSGRQVRFDVVQGNYQIQTTNPGQPLAQTLTVTSDAAGTAQVLLQVPVNAITQLALIRVTDLTSGNQVTGQFAIAQVVGGEAILSTIPSPESTTTITGPLQNVCSTGVRTTTYIFGGTPPYRVLTNFPDAVTLVGVPVNANGGGFDTITNGSCFINMVYAITDATGRTIGAAGPKLTNQPGTIAPTPPPAPTPLSIAPTAVTATACPGKTFQFVIVGGTGPFSASASPAVPGSPIVTIAGNQVTISNVTLTGATNVTVTDSSAPQGVASAIITCS